MVLLVVITPFDATDPDLVQRMLRFGIDGIADMLPVAPRTWTRH